MQAALVAAVSLRGGTGPGPSVCDIQNRQTHRDRDFISGCQGLGAGEWEWLLTGNFLSENILNLDCGDNGTTLNILRTTELCNLNEGILR